MASMPSRGVQTTSCGDKVLSQSKAVQRVEIAVPDRDLWWVDPGLRH